MRGRFVTLEGPEGSGKSTQAARLVAELEALGLEVLYTREPGGTPTGDMIRGILQHDTSGEVILPESELLLFAASRAQLVGRIIRPALERGTWVICDRFIDSTTAYQGYGRGFPIDVVQNINAFATGGLLPDITFLLNVDVATGAERMAQRNQKAGRNKDRFEREDMSYHQRVHAGYLALAQREPGRFCVVNAARGPEEVFKDLWAAVSKLRGQAS